ncbi:MAG TPA: hypothetical protein VFV56_01640 [Gaiellaceae bacterium]|nr:hypothetical protein [Gaiellaceae bacterium]
MGALSEIPVRTLTSVEDTGGQDGPSAGIAFDPWSPVELPAAERPTSMTLVVLAVAAGIGALVLGALAGLSAVSWGSDGTPSVERQALALLAKPSTERIVFRGSGGRLVLAIGSAGRAAVSIRGFGQATSETPYYAWIVGSGAPVRAATIDGSERAVFLSQTLVPGDDVVVATHSPAGVGPNTPLVASRD